MAELQRKDRRIFDLSNDRARLKALLKKAKTALDSLNNKLKNAQVDIQMQTNRATEAMSKNKELTKTLEIVQAQRSGVEKTADVKELLCRVKVNGTGYTLVQLKNLECVWHADSMLLNVQEALSKEFKALKPVSYPQILRQQEQSEKALVETMQQYEERLKRVNEYMEQSNQAYLKSQEELNSLRRKFQNDLQARDNALSILIDRSIDLKSAVMTIDEKVQNYMTQRAQKGKGQRMPTRKVNLADQVSDLELQITKLMTDANSD